MSLSAVQLSLNVDRHPHLPDDGMLMGTLKLGGGFAVPRDLQPGEELTVTVADADGQVIAASRAEVETVAFPPIKDKGVAIGTERRHKAALKL